MQRARPGQLLEARKLEACGEQHFHAAARVFVIREDTRLDEHRGPVRKRGRIGHLHGGRGRRSRGRGERAGPGSRASALARRDHAHFDGRRTRAQHVELRRGGVGQIDDAVPDERATVVDAHDDLASVCEVRDLRVRGYRQCLVRGRHGVHVVRFAERRRRRVKSGAVPRSGAALDPAVRARHDVITLAEHFVERRVSAAAARLGAGHGIGDREDVGWHFRYRRSGRDRGWRWGGRAGRLRRAARDAATGEHDSGESEDERRAAHHRAAVSASVG
jgi:hypothetical protein